MTNYSSRTHALTIALDRCGLAATNPALDSALDDSAGKIGTAVAYRPYLAAALWLEERRSVLVSAEGATFRESSRAELALRNRQAAVDASAGITPPAGFPALRASSSGSPSSVGVPVQVVW